MPTSTVTSKGQITIPSEVRAELGLQTGSKVTFVRAARGVYEFVPVTGTIASLKGSVPTPDTPVSLAEMEDAVAEGAARRGSR